MKKYLSFPFADDAPSTPAAALPKSPTAPEYQFEGFTVVINEKITLTPIQRNKKKKHG